MEFYKGYGIRLYKDTRMYRIYYMCPHNGHVYLDGQYLNSELAKEYIDNLGYK